MSNTGNTIVIGSSPKFRGEYSSTAIYYEENIVTSYGSVFKASANAFQDMPPIVEALDGTISLSENGCWITVIDNVDLYNAVLSTNSLSTRVTNLENNVTEISGNMRPIVILTASEYEELVSGGTVDENTIYMVKSN